MAYRRKMGGRRRFRTKGIAPPSLRPGFGRKPPPDRRPGWGRSPAPIVGPKRPSTNPPDDSRPAKRPKAPAQARFSANSNSIGAGRVSYYKKKKFNRRAWVKKLWTASSAQTHYQSMFSSVAVDNVLSLTTDKVDILNLGTLDDQWWNNSKGGAYVSTAFKTSTGNSVFIRGGICHLQLTNTGSSVLRFRIFSVFGKPEGTWPGYTAPAASHVAPKGYKPSDELNYFKEFSVSSQGWDKILDPGETWNLSRPIRAGKFLIDGSAVATGGPPPKWGNYPVPIWTVVCGIVGSATTTAGQYTYQQAYDVSYSADLIA